MRPKYLGEVVRQRRESLKLSQDIVCEGICTIMTISRFESGKQTPSWDCVKAILQRLGLSHDQYYVQLTRMETRLVNLRKEANAYSNQFERTLGEEREQARRNALKKLHELERLVKEDDHINRQFILGTKATVEPHPPEVQLAMVMEAIRLTSPRFDLDDLSSCLYSTAETLIINQIAIRYALCGHQSRAIEIYDQLLKLVQDRTPDHGYLHVITHNYALYLALEKRFEEALEISKIGRQACIKHGYYNILPQFLHTEAGCMHRIGENNRSLELYLSAYYIYGATKDTKSREALRTFIEENFDLTL